MNNPLIIGLSAGMAFLLAFQLIGSPKKHNRKANIWIGAFVATIAVAFLEIFIYNLNLQKQYPYLLDGLEMSRLLSAPTLFLSIQFFTDPNKVFRQKDLWHFLPFLLFFLFRLPQIYHGSNGQFLNDTIQQIVITIIRFILPVQSVLYWLLSYQILQKYEKNISKISSNIENIDLKWLRNFLLILVLLIVFWLNLAIFEVSFLYILTPYVYLISIIFLAHFTLKQTEIYPYKKEVLKELTAVIEESNSIEKAKYQRLTVAEMSEYKATLTAIMEQGKVYLDNDLSLPQLAQKMMISPQDLSYLINETYNENFFSFINRHRIEAAKQLLLSEKYQQLNIQGIAYEAGFNSKTTFNNTFKKQIGLTPTDFIKKELAKK